MNTDLIEKLKNLPDDRIGDGIYVAYEWHDGKLSRIYIGSKINGPMLQYDADGTAKYNGKEEINFNGGCWTNCYSRGNFGKKYAFGGSWSGHTKNLHPKLMLSKLKDSTKEILISDDGIEIVLPKGIKGEISVTQLDCSGSWSIWYPTAGMAIKERLTAEEVNQSSLPEVSKQHLLKNETSGVLDALNDVIEAYNL